MIKKPTNFLLSTLSVAIFSSLTSAAQLQPVAAANSQAQAGAKSQSFARWLDDNKRNKKADITDRFIVDFDDELMPNAIAEIQGKGKGKGVGRELRGKAGKMLKHFESILGEAPGLVKAKSKGKAVFAVGRAQSVAKMNRIASRLAKGKGVKHAEADPRRFLMAQNQPWGISEVQADQLSDSNSDNMTVCIIDSGYDINHPDLSGNQHSGTNDSGTGNWYQPGGSHGTHVAGTIAAINNSEGVEGVLPNQNVNLHIVKVFTESGWAYSSDLVDAVTTCANNGSDVVNMSLGGAFFFCNRTKWYAEYSR